MFGLLVGNRYRYHLIQVYVFNFYLYLFILVLNLDLFKIESAVISMYNHHHNTYILKFLIYNISNIYFYYTFILNSLSTLVYYIIN